MKKLFSTQPFSMDIGLLVLRLCCGLMIIHGWAKYTNYEEVIVDWPDPLHVGIKASFALTVFAEVICSALVMIGLFTRLSLTMLIVMMLVIVFNIHGGDSFGDREHGLLYLLMYVSLFLTGPGRYSVDVLLSRKK